MYISTRRTKLCVVATAMSIAACTCAVAVPSSALAQTEEAAPIVSARSAHAVTGSVSSAVGDTRAAATPDPVSVPAAGTPAQPANSTQSGTSLAQPDASSTTSSANQPATSQPAAGNTDDSLTWTKDDFNISADGKTIGGRKIVHHPDTGETVDGYVDGLTAKGKEKLKKNHHIVIPEGIEVIHECAFTGHAKQVGNQHVHIDGETYIEGVTLPQSLRIIEYGAFGWNKIKGTLTIPKNVISIHSVAFVANEIEKVVFEGVIDGKGKEHDTDTAPYYLAGIGEKAFQGNKISEIVVKGNLSNYKFHPSTDPSKGDSVFDNQNPGTFTIEVGEEYKRPITFTQASGNHSISVVEGFKENGNPVQIENSSYFTKNNAGKYVAAKEGTFEGQCLFYDTFNNSFRVLGISHFTYKILPKSKIYTVTFVNENNQNYAKVQAKENKCISDKSVLNQVMPAQPSKTGFTFKGWNTQSDGTGTPFDDSTPVSGDITVYAQYEKVPSPKPQPQPNPEPKPQPNPELKPQPAPAPVPAPDPTPAPVPGPTPAPAPNMNPELQQEEPGRTPHVTPPASEQGAFTPNDTPVKEPPVRPADEQHVQQARMPRTSDMALLGMLASTSALACAVVCGAITALKRRK